MIERPIVVVLALLGFVVLVIMGCIVWRFIVEPQLEALNARHKAEPTVEPEPEPEHRPESRSTPFPETLWHDSEPVTGSLAKVQARQGDKFPRAMVVVHDNYLGEDTRRPR